MVSAEGLNEVLKPEDLVPGVMLLTRQQLYDLVWAEPMSLLAARFGISDVALAKRYRRMSVPIPPRGYWARLKAGQRMAKSPLVDVKGIPPVMQVHVLEHGAAKVERSLTKSEPRPKVPVAERLTNPHPLVELTRIALLAQKGPISAVTRRNLPPREHLDVRNIDRSCIPRAMRLLDALLKECGRRGHQVFIRKGESFISIGNHSYEFWMDEILERRPHTATPQELARAQRESWYAVPKYNHVSVGQLGFHLWPYLDSPRKNWRDGKHQRLEDMLGDILENVETAAEIARQRAIQRAEEARIAAEVRRRKELIEKRKRDEAERVEALADDAKRWRQAAKLQEYVEAVEQAAVTRGMANDENVQRWISWARAQAKKLDPLKYELPTRLAEWDLPFDFE